MATDRHILIAGNEGLIRMTTDRFRKLCNDRIAVDGAVRRDFKPTIDRFPDEWPDSGFRKIGKNRIQVNSNLSDKMIAIDIRDPALIERLCSPGAIDRLHIVTGPGDSLETSVWMARQGHSLASPIFDGATPGLQAAWHVTPSADRLFIELIYSRPEDDTSEAKWNRIFIGRSPAGDRLGDLAIDLQLPTADGRDYESLLAPDDPTAAPRFILEKP
jgi:hypothetical protein